MGQRDSKAISVAHSFAGDSAVGDAVAAARLFAQAAGVGPKTKARLAIIVEELVTNIFEHGSPSPDRSVELWLTKAAGDIELTLADNGSFFDPRSFRAPADAVPERGGGAGLGLVQAWSRILRYGEESGANRLELVIADEG